MDFDMGFQIATTPEYLVTKVTFSLCFYSFYYFMNYFYMFLQNILCAEIHSTYVANVKIDLKIDMLFYDFSIKLNLLFTFIHIFGIGHVSVNFSQKPKVSRFKWELILFW